MASAKPKKRTTAAVQLPECPVCLETMSSPIFQCSSGHSLCHSCTRVLCPPICPICRQPMTQMRNWQLEEIILQAEVACPNKSAGCVYKLKSINVQEHLKECTFRMMDCPVAVFGKCSWRGLLKDIMDHFKERHPTKCNVSSDTEVELEKVDVKEDERFVYLVTHGKLLFIITVKVDTVQKMAYWAIQAISSKHVAQQHVYEIHITSKKDIRRKVVFVEHCFNDAIKADEVFRQNKCAVLPLQMLNHFILDKKLSFRFFIKRAPPISKTNKTKADECDDNKWTSSEHRRPDSKAGQQRPRAQSGPRVPRKGPSSDTR